MRNLILLIVAIAMISIAVVSFFLFNEHEDTMPFSVGNKTYFQIPFSKIQQYTLSSNESLFSGDSPKTEKSVVDIFELTPTVVYYLNETLLHEKTYPYDQQLRVNVLNGPFYLHLDESNQRLDLMIDGFICYRIGYRIISGNLSVTLLNGSKQFYLHDNPLNSIVIDNVNDSCIFPLIFNEKKIHDISNCEISIIPATIIEEALFLSVKNAQCELRINNLDFGLLVSVLKANSSYLGGSN